MILDLEAPADAHLIVQLTQPVEQRVEARLADLLEENVVTFTGGFTTESYIINRLVGPSEYAAQVQWNDKPSGQGTDWYYARITQHNGHMAWTSPIWVG